METTIDNSKEKVQESVNPNIMEKEKAPESVNPNILEKEKVPESVNPLFEKYKALSTIKRAIRASARYNKKLNKQRSEERRAYFDLQTMSVHYPQKPSKYVLKEKSSIGLYPVAIYPWQYQDYYQKFTANDLEKLPINTPIKSIISSKNIYNDDYLKIITDYREQCKRRMASKEFDNYDPKNFGEQSGQTQFTSNPNYSNDNPIAPNQHFTTLECKALNDESDTISIESLQKTNQMSAEWCNICGFPPLAESILKGHLINCATCTKVGHPACFGLNIKMNQSVSTYAWQCIECKTCFLCTNPENEAELMCCDNCDRGYHSYCVGLKAIPEGDWVCQLCQELIQTDEIAGKNLL